MQAQGAKSYPEQHPTTPGANLRFTVANGMFTCGIDIPTIFKGESQAKRISGEVFDDDFVSCMDKQLKN